MRDLSGDSRRRRTHPIGPRRMRGGSNLLLVSAVLRDGNDAGLTSRSAGDGTRGEGRVVPREIEQVLPCADGEVEWA
jgi:hypothetical protein